MDQEEKTLSPEKKELLKMVAIEVVFRLKSIKYINMIVSLTAKKRMN